MSNVAFRNKIAAFVRKCEQRPEQVARALAFGLLRDVVLMSPVDTGRFRGNWNVQFDTTPQTSLDVDPSGSATLGRASARLGQFTLAMGRIFLLNHLPYSIELEYGHSAQAPQGMVRLTVQRYDQILRKIVRELR